MRRNVMISVAAAVLLFAMRAMADGGTTDGEAAKSAAAAALAEKADVPAGPPALPSHAAERATEVHDSIAFGQKGEAIRAAHRQVEQEGNDEGEAARAEAANRAAQGAAASAAGAANADAHAAAGQARGNSHKPTLTQTQRGR
jgi:hypothetical protein